MDEVKGEKQYAMCSTPSCISSCPWALLLVNFCQGLLYAPSLSGHWVLSRLLLAPIGFLVNKDLNNCLWTQAPCQCMRHTPTLPSLSGTFLAPRWVGWYVWTCAHCGQAVAPGEDGDWTNIESRCGLYVWKINAICCLFCLYVRSYHVPHFCLMGE